MLQKVTLAPAPPFPFAEFMSKMFEPVRVLIVHDTSDGYRPSVTTKS